MTTKTLTPWQKEEWNMQTIRRLGGVPKSEHMAALERAARCAGEQWERRYQSMLRYSTLVTGLWIISLWAHLWIAFNGVPIWRLP